MALDYDYIIVGLGAAGMSLAYYLTQNGVLDNKQVLILEKADKTDNDRTWTFWGTPPEPINQIIQKTWPHIFVRNGKTATKLDASDMPYHYLPAHKFYQALLPAIETHPHITWVKEAVTNIQQDDQAAYVTAGGQTYTSAYVFNSAYPFSTSMPDIQDQIAYQRFQGWEVVFEKPVLDDDCLTLMDFDMPHSRDLRFMYGLPLSPERLILNCTIFGREAQPAKLYEQNMAKYLQNHYPGVDYRIDRREGGMIPMSHLPLKRYDGKRVVNMGILGGDTRPSTGYTFLNAVRFSKTLAHCLKEQKPFPQGTWGKRPYFYDTLLLQVLSDSPKSLRMSFMALFLNNNARQIFRFLDGSTHIWEEIRLVLTLPYTPFLKALFKNLYQKARFYEPGLSRAKS